MKISIISDTHFGFKWGEERGEDSFENAREAFERSLDADLIILPGDLFDKKIPKQEVLDKATEVFSVAMEGERNVEADKDLGIHGNGIPTVAIHGTHERRPRSYTNPIELMANTGHLHHLDNETTVFQDKETGEKVAVHGMSGVPERYAPKVLEKFDPEPVEDAFNILVIHQSVEGFVYTDSDHEYLSIEDFPEGFDLIVNGHIHWYNLERYRENEDKPFILPGSTITTQMNKVEAEKPKGFVELDTETGEMDFKPLESARNVEYVELEVEGEQWSDIKERAVEELEKVEKDGKPLVNLKIKGETDGRINPRELKQMFRERMFLNVNSSLKSERQIKEQDISEKMDPWEKGKEILSQKIDSETGIEETELLELLKNENPDKAEKMLKESVREKNND